MLKRVVVSAGEKGGAQEERGFSDCGAPWLRGSIGGWLAEATSATSGVRKINKQKIHGGFDVKSKVRTGLQEDATRIAGVDGAGRDSLGWATGCCGEHNTSFRFRTCPMDIGVGILAICR